MRTSIRLTIIWLVSSSIVLNLVLFTILRSKSSTITVFKYSKPSSSSSNPAASYLQSAQVFFGFSHADAPEKPADAASSSASRIAAGPENKPYSSASEGSVSTSSNSSSAHSHSQLTLQLIQTLSDPATQQRPMDVKFYVGPGLVNGITPPVTLPEGAILRSFRWNISDSLLAANGDCESLDYGFQEVPRVPEAVTEEMMRRFETPGLGGVWMPEDCQPRDRVAILVPYRNREANLKIFLAYMHFFLQQQGVDYGIYVLEQQDNHKFNRGKLFNIGFQLTQAMHNYTCYMLHDIDKLPEDTRHSYTCQDKPVHMISSIRKSYVQHMSDMNKTNTTGPYRDGEVYKGFFGGVSALTADHYRTINGMINTYWGWGGEDDDLYGRCKAKNLLPLYPKKPHGKYLILYHPPDAQYSHRPMPKYPLVKRRMAQNGLSSLKYEILDIQYKPLYTHIVVKL